MPNREEHKFLSATVGLVTTVRIKKDLNLANLSGAFIVSTIAGILPDILEPATSPNHRSFFHSLLLAGIVIYGREKLYDKLQLTPQMRYWCNLFLICYGVHLVADCFTPKGLPIIC